MRIFFYDLYTKKYFRAKFFCQPKTFHRLYYKSKAPRKRGPNVTSPKLKKLGKLRADGVGHSRI